MKLRSLGMVSERWTICSAVDHSPSGPPGNPMVILLDLKMPRMDVVQRIKADEQLHLIPVFVLTSSRETLDLEACYRLGVSAYVVKPVHFLEFVDAIKQTGVFWALINQPPPDSMPGKGG